MICPTHNKEMRSGRFGLYCSTKLEDGSWCKYKVSSSKNAKPNEFSLKNAMEMKREGIDKSVALNNAIALVTGIKKETPESALTVAEEVLEMADIFLSWLQKNENKKQTEEPF